jgi:hypothetical protein
VVLWVSYKSETCPQAIQAWVKFYKKDTILYPIGLGAIMLIAIGILIAMIKYMPPTIVAKRPILKLVGIDLHLLY